MKARGKEESSLFTGYARLSIGSQTGVTLNFSKAQPLDQNPVTVSTAMSGASTGGNAPVASQKADDQYSTPIPSQSKGDGDIIWDKTEAEIASTTQAEILDQVANLHVDPSSNSGFNKVWCWYRLTSFRRSYPEYQSASDNLLVKRLYEKVGLKGLLTFNQSFQPWTVLFQSIGFAIGVPLAVLALGSAGYWALAGFKNAS